MPKLPCVAIVGRPNVGKSSLLNALAGKLISIVQDMPGVTRDRISTHIEIAGRYIELVDTGGYGFEDPDALTSHIKEQIEHAMRRADLVLFIVDCQNGLTSADQEVANLLRREGIKAILVANKADGENADIALGDFARLGLGTPIGVSALTGRNVDEVLEAIEKNLDLSNAPTKLAAPDMHLAIVGKRNAGKSTLVNAIAGVYEGDKNRVIVSEVPGTTRDSVDVRFEKDGKTLVVIDTAGVRKKRHMVTNGIEFYSFHRAQRSVRRADVVLMLIDGTEAISEPDRKLGQYIAGEFKPVILVVNKWDLTMQTIRDKRKGQDMRDEDIMEEYSEYLTTELPWLDYAPIAFTTAKDGKNIQRVLDISQHLHRQASERLGTGKLNTVVKQILEERSCPTPSGNRLKVFYATQVEVSPPTIILFVNQPAYVTPDYQRFIVNRMRDLLPYSEVPIRLDFRGRGQRGASMEDKPEGLTATPATKPAGTGAGKAPAKQPAKPAAKRTTLPSHRKRGAGHRTNLGKNKRR
jgi:GTP-binding protein